MVLSGTQGLGIHVDDLSCVETQTQHEIYFFLTCSVVPRD